MTPNSLKQLEHGISELEKYIEYNSACNKTISECNGVDQFTPGSIIEIVRISTGFNRKKIFEYNSYIISLYGLFERFLENVIGDYLIDICKILKLHSKLPNDLQKNTLNSNVDILRNLSNPKFISISIPNFIHNLNEAYCNDKAIINVEAFQHHPYNFKHSIIAEYFSRIGLGGISSYLKIYEPLKSILEQNYGNPAQIESDLVFKIIDDLAQRRNDVAHGVENIEILNITIIKEYITFILAYSRSIFEILLNERNLFLFNEIENNLTLISVINHSIVCGTLSPLTLSNSDKLLIEKPEGNFPRYEMLSIQDIQVNHKSYQTINIVEKTNVGIQVNGYIKDNYKFKLITAPNTG